MALEIIAEFSKKALEQMDPKSTPDKIVVNESTGTCPECESANVAMEGRYPRCLYKCGQCGLIWINDEQTFFRT